jgi:hypothetical protein
MDGRVTAKKCPACGCLIYGADAIDAIRHLNLHLVDCGKERPRLSFESMVTGEDIVLLHEMLITTEDPNA